METQLVIEPAKEEHCRYLSELALRSKAHWGYSAEFIEKCRPHIYVDSDYINHWPVYLGRLEKTIIGFYSLKTIDSEDRLDNLWIEPKYIGQGFGRQLLLHSIDSARNLGWNSFRLAGESKAIPFYEKMGAQQIGQIQSRLGNDILLPHMGLIF